MVEPSFLVGIAVVFVVALAFILKQTSAAPETEKKKVERKVNKQPKKTKGPQRNSLKKDRRPPDVKEWVGVDNPQKDAQDMLEFLKGKDPAELAKQHNQGKGNKKKQQQQQQVKKPKVEESTSEDSASEGQSEDGFSKIVRKTKTEKKKDNNKKKKEKEETRAPSNKSFFKPPPGAEGEVKPGEKKPKRDRKPQTENAAAEGGAAPQERKRERRDRPEGERKERPEGERKDRPEGERKERRENPDRPQRKPLPTVAPIVKYEQADLTDILASITQDFDSKPKPKANRLSTIFSKIPRNIVVNILERVEARDLVALSRVNHYFSGVARKESLWRDILLRDFGIKDAGKYRNCRLAYKAEFKKRKAAAKKKKEEKEKPVVAATEAPVEAVQKEESKNEDQPAAKEPKQKKDNKKKKEEKPATDATAED